VFGDPALRPGVGVPGLDRPYWGNLIIGFACGCRTLQERKVTNKISGGARWAQPRDRVLETPEGAQAYGEGWLCEKPEWTNEEERHPTAITPFRRGPRRPRAL